MFFAAAFAMSLMAPKAATKQPAWLDFSIASYILRYDDKHELIAVHDPKSGCYLLRTVECDGGIVTLTLTRDQSVVEEMGLTKSNPELKVVEKALPSLSTGHGIKIGDSPAAVRKKLGNPTDTDKDDFLTYTYSWKTKINKYDGEYRDVYIFKKGKLIEISFTRDDGVG